MPNPNTMFDAIEKNLKLGGELVQSISDEQFRDTTVPPYHASIGGHMRHILDIFDCIFSGLAKGEGQIDLTARERRIEVETDRQVCLAYIDRVLSQLNALRDEDIDQLVDVTDDLGCGPVTLKYTIAAGLSQAHSHAIHHFASLGYVNCCLGIRLPHPEFGYNPTTPREETIQ